MATEQLQIKVGADVASANSAIKILQGQLERLQKIAAMPNLSFQQYERLGGLISRTQNQLNGLSKAFNTTSSAAGQVGGSFGRLANNSNAADQSLINLSRVVQDMPYGFIGIANNINPLLEGFQRVQRESGSTGAAFKSLLGSLSGAGGLGLAFGAISSLLVVFGDKLFSSKNDTIQLKNAMDQLNDSAKAVGKSIGELGSSLSFLNQFSTLQVQIAGGGDPEIINQQILNTEQSLTRLFRARRQLVIQQTEAINQSVNGANEEIKKSAGETLNTISDELNKSFDEEAELNGKKILLSLQLKKAKIDGAKEAAQESSKQREKELKEAEEWAEKMKEVFEGIKNFQIKATKIDFSQVPEIRQKPDYSGSFLRGEESQSGFGNSEGIFGLPTKEQLDKMIKDAEVGLKRIQDQAERLAKSIASVVAPAFTGLFDAILAGENPIKGFFDGLMQSVRRLIESLIQAALQAAVLSMLSNIIPGMQGMGFGKAFGQVMGFGGGGGFANRGFGGGNVSGVMNRNMGGIQTRGMAITVSGQLVGQGSQLRAVINNANTLSGIIR